MSNYDRVLRNSIAFAITGVIVVAIVGATLAQSLRERHAKLTNKIEEVSDGTGN
jgi:uncharacterized SAM-binding protein YcdF (DUF218 family)